MTPGARVQAAIEILDAIETGIAAEAALIAWARRSRFAGSGDRAAVRDHVYDVLRARQSASELGQGVTGRDLMLGFLRRTGTDPATLFSGEGHAPAPPSPAEIARLSDRVVLSRAAELDLPEWLIPDLERSLGGDLAPIAALFRDRAAVFVRVNSARGTRDQAIAALAAEGIAARAHPLSPTALVLDGAPRGLRNSRAFVAGLIELQDAASQAVIDALAVAPGARVLDYCAGGGGKSLALAARGAKVFAHDIDAARMGDIPARAARAGVEVTLLDKRDIPTAGPFDIVLCDVPCSGSGAWRRQPEAKWRLTRQRLDDLIELQSTILDEAAGHAARGLLCYATCSVLIDENEGAIDRFLAANTGWRCAMRRRISPLEGADGFFTAHLTQDRPAT